MRICCQAEIRMLPPESRYSKWRWFWTIASLVLYSVDIVTDVGLVFKYVQEGHCLWAVLTLAFVLVGLMATQIFSYAWYIDDMSDDLVNPGGNTIGSGLGSAGLVSLHVLGMGIFTRYIQLLENGRRELWPGGGGGGGGEEEKEEKEEERAAHHRLFCLATDLSMLKLFEAFLESIPQLLLQIYLVLDHVECSPLQYLCMAFSFLNAAWALVDYRRCLRRSLPAVREMPSGLPTAVYLLYKLSSITAGVLAYALLLSLSAYSAVALAALWLLGTLWAHALRTHFCTRGTTEWVYRAVVGVVLAFTFFNVKGGNTRTPMSLYYVLRGAVNAAAPLLFATLRSPPTPATELWYFWPVAGAIAVGTAVGPACLAAYYACMHPGGPPPRREADEVDGAGRPPEAGRRMKACLQL